MSQPQRFRKKPVVIEAVQWQGRESWPVIRDWALGGNHIPNDGFRTDGDGLFIDTLEGTHLTQPGDWVIKGVQGEFYPCKPDIFDATYERAGVEVTAWQDAERSFVGEAPT